MTKQSFFKTVSGLVLAGLLSATLIAQSVAANGNNGPMQNKITQKLASKKQFRDVKAEVENGTVTLTGTVDLYQRKLDADKLARKISGAQAVRDEITVAGAKVSDEQLGERLSRKLTYVRSGYDSTFDYFALSVKDGVVVVQGADRTGVGRQEALGEIYNTPGVKDVVDNISVEPASPMDDGLRLRAARVIYRDPVLSKYAMDPARPIRIIVENGHVTLYGTVINSMDKTIAGIRANQLPGAFTVQNNLVVVDGKSGEQEM
ncbi:MAG: BON domain-containing protein [Candidatus Sulfotelmatobacter sp.]